MKIKYKLCALFLFPLLSQEAVALSYNWSEDNDGLVTRCFDRNNIQFHCENFSTSQEKKERIAELQISATDSMGKKFFYSYEKGQSEELCIAHELKIRRLLKGSRQACITGGIEWNDKADNSTASKWVAFETHKGRVNR